MVVDELTRLRKQMGNESAPEPLLRRLRGEHVQEEKQDAPVQRRRQSASEVRARIAALHNR